MKLKQMGVVALAAGLVLLQGCSFEPIREEGAPAEEGAYEQAQGGEQAAAEAGAESSGVAMDGEFAGKPITELLSDANSPLSTHTFFFAFNSAELSEKDREILATHARLLNEKSDINVEIEGHADERGSREYNLALGERRAKVIERLFSLHGVSPAQITVTSWGEERPMDPGHDEDAWRQNRRAKLNYSGY